jgi:hypothetical protein
MKDLYQRYRGKRNKVVDAYAEAEMAGRVPRRSNKRCLTPLGYASRLFSDGIRKRWLTEA